MLWLLATEGDTGLQSYDFTCRHPHQAAPHPTPNSHQQDLTPRVPLTRPKSKCQSSWTIRQRFGGRGGEREEPPSKFTRVTGKIQFLAVTDLMSLIASWWPAGMHFLLPEAPWTPSHRSSSIITPECQIPLLPHQMSMGPLFSNS